MTLFRGLRGDTLFAPFLSLTPGPPPFSSMNRRRPLIPWLDPWPGFAAVRNYARANVENNEDSDSGDDEPANKGGL